jgi:hypothetical protein
MGASGFLITGNASYDLLPFGTCVAQVCPDSGATCVKPMPEGGFGMRIR